MTGELLEQLKAMDQAVLTKVVRKDQRDPDLAILDWSVEPISYEIIIDTTGGLYRFSGLGQGAQGIRPWAVVLKCINNPVVWGQEPKECFYWRRESLAFQSGFLEQLPPGVRAPHYYGVMVNEKSEWVWIEHIQESTGKRWSMDTFQLAARQLGRFQGAYLDGTPLPERSWLCRPFFRSEWAEEGFWSGFMDPSSAENAWKSLVVRRGFEESQKSRVLQLIAEKEHLFDANDRIPQVLCHNDAHRRNFMWSHSSQTGEQELIGIDWAFTGVGALGNDLGELVGSCKKFEYDPWDVETLEAAVLEGYLAGIADTGVRVDPRLVRLGYLIALSFWIGAMQPGWAAIMLPSELGANARGQDGRSVEEVLAGWVRLEAFCLDRTDEARSLIRQLGF